MRKMEVSLSFVRIYWCILLSVIALHGSIVSAFGEETADKTAKETEAQMSYPGSEGMDKETEMQLTELNLKYDDRYLFPDPIKGIIQGEIQVLKQDKAAPNKVWAVECGTARVSLEDGTEINVTVEPAPITMVLIAGQSNGEGRPSEADKIKKYKGEQLLCQEGTVYGSYGPSDEYGQDMYKEVAWYKDKDQIGQLTVDNAFRFIPNSLADNSQNDRYCKTNRLSDAEKAGGKGGMDAAFGWRWYSLTGEKVWVINAAHHGCKIETWDPSEDGSNYAEAVAMFHIAEEVLAREIEAGHYRLAHKAVLWNQGENNRGMSVTEYLQHLENVKEALWKDLSGEKTMGHLHQPDFFGIILVRSGTMDGASDLDFKLTGPRAAQYYAVSSGKHQDMYLASQVREEWHTDEDVSQYFVWKYGTEEAYNAAYPTREGHIVMPSTVDEVRKNIHYTQLAYNEIGIDAAENMCYQMGYVPEPEDPQIRIEVVKKDGIINILGDSITAEKGDKIRLAVKVFPTWLTKELEIETGDGIVYKAGTLRIKTDQPAALEIKVRGIEEVINID